LYYVPFDNNFKFYANLLIASELSFNPHAFTESISFTETNFTDIVSFVVHYPEFYARRRAAAQGRRARNTASSLVNKGRRRLKSFFLSLH